MPPTSNVIARMLQQYEPFFLRPQSTPVSQPQSQSQGPNWGQMIAQLIQALSQEQT
jgi:hypothetical protein